MKNENKKTGNQGEYLARKYLEEKGYEIIETNFYCRFGEVDIIAKNKKCNRHKKGSKRLFCTFYDNITCHF